MDDLRKAGRINKTHGVAGELSVSVDDPDWIEAVKPGVPLLLCIDGIFVPFFVEAVRPRGAGSLLVTLDGISTQPEASTLTGKDVYMRRSDLPEQPDDDVLYAQDMIGYTVYTTDSDNPFGEISSVDDSTENALFVIRRNDSDKPLLVPVAEDFIDYIDTEGKEIHFDLPEGLLSL